MTAKRIRFKGAVYRLAEQDYDLSLELLCADDFGAGYRDEDDWDEADRDHAENYQETRDKQHEVAELLGRAEIQVDVTDTDDRQRAQRKPAGEQSQVERVDDGARSRNHWSHNPALYLY